MQTAAERFAATVADATERYVADLLADKAQLPRSRALGFAVTAGLPAQMAYTLSETAKYTGVPASVLTDEINAGRLRATKAHGRQRGAVIPVQEVDRWMTENTR